jgi:hypothetical protein
MSSALYSARIGDSHSIAEGVPYDELLKCIMEFTVRSALARSIDESDWEHDELRRKGLVVLQIFHNGKAVWADTETFTAELAEARREHCERFERINELDPALYDRLDRDLRVHWRRAGYDVPSLLHDMKKLFIELERDASDHAAGAREALLHDLLNGSHLNSS